MKLKELHIRNIASIERADIDFEKDLNDAISGDPVSIFLISGDTGSGKSVILDSISMALYKNTPRIAGVANKRENDFTNTEGESIKIASIEQYTRLGISEKDESYSEVVFEGNDGKEYHARLTLGMMLSNKDKETGLRPLKHRPSKWEMRVGSADWTKDNVEKTLQQAVGVDFQQFGRMAMLAQGQFANFLTGDKKEREAILEQLTDTQIFSSYGEAITSLWKKAKEAQATIQTQYDTEKPHTLNDDEVESLTQEQQDNLRQRDALDEKIKAQDDQLKWIEQVLHNEKMQAEARQELQRLQAVAAGEKYRQCKTLFTDWDTTTAQRQTLADLLRAKREEQTANDRLQASHDTFQRLSADILDRRNQLKTLDDAIALSREWIDQRKLHDSLFAKAGETDLQIAQYISKTEKASHTDSLLQAEKARTEPLQKAEADAVLRASQAEDAVKAKTTEIDTLSRQRTALNAQAINARLSQAEATRRSLEDLRKACDSLSARLKEADELRRELKADEQKRATLKEAMEKAESDYQAKKDEAEKADKLLTTMQMSVEETLVTLRRRLREENAGTCPLCGQPIDHAHLDDDFKGILTPLEEEQRKASDALSTATSQRDNSHHEFSTLDGALQGKASQLAKADAKNADDKQHIEQTATEMGLNIREPLIPQTESALTAVCADIETLRASQQEAERLQDQINKLLDQKRPLDAAQIDAEKAKTTAENKLKANAEAITRLQTEYAALLQECEAIKAAVSQLLSGYADDWQSDTEALRKRLAADAKEYTARQKQLSDDIAKHDKTNALIDTLSNISDSIIQSCPDWQAATQPDAYPCRDINIAWTTLMSEVTTVTSKLRECKQTIAACTASLAAYYQASGKSEDHLLTLIAQEAQVAPARKFVSDTDSRLTSRTDAIIDAQGQIDAALRALSIQERSALPDKQQLEEEKNATNALRDQLLSRIATIRDRLGTHQANIKKLKQIESELEAAQQRRVRWERLNNIFGGTRFRTLVQTYILRPLLNNANIYLEQITDRYRLTCSEDNEQLSILVLDRYNKDQVRSVTVLSGGERFMISLALSLALSSLNRPDMNVNILFIDEGFGTLDEKSLDSVMQTLEKLQEIAGQTNRRVGIISHREELEERIPVKIQVLKKGEGRSHIRITNAFAAGTP